jgi:hypothetical protein
MRPPGLRAGPSSDSISFIIFQVWSVAEGAELRSLASDSHLLEGGKVPLEPSVADEEYTTHTVKAKLYSS